VTSGIVRSKAGHASATVEISPDDRWLAARGSAVHVWEVGSWREVALFPSDGRVLVAFSPDSRLLAFAVGFGVVAVADVASGKQLMGLQTQGGKNFRSLLHKHGTTKLLGLPSMDRELPIH
jgi:hypothetical protein